VGSELCIRDSDTDCVCEDLVDLATEISIIAVRNAKDEVVCYDPVQMDVHSDANLLDELVFPASVDNSIANKAKELAAQIIRAFDICGLLAVEFFVSTNKELLINEVAPRPHNSGHQTIESCITSQYENHIRGILNFPLGSTKIIQPSVMINVLGEPGYAGPVVYEGLEACLAEEGIKVHIYGKKETRPMRKMGHITIIAPTVEAAKQKAKWVKQTLKVKA
jgi:5-(carboxyamino)imidazole ribonucleotide synthase